MHPSEPLINLSSAVHVWWCSKRPRDYTEQNHLNYPEVNCATSAEIELARAHAEVVKFKGRLPAGIYEGFATGNQVTVTVPDQGFAFIINTEDYVKGVNCPVSVRVSEDQDGGRNFSVTYGKPLGHVMNRAEPSDGRTVAPSGLVFHQDPPDAE